MLHAHICEIHQSHQFSALRDQLAGQVKLTWGDTAEAGDYDLLVAGYPDEAALSRSGKLQTLIIPWAGLPVPTRTMLLAHPELKVHNLHHNAKSVAETAIALMLGVAKRLLHYDKKMRQHDWGDRIPPPFDALHLGGKTALILGYGAIGKHTATLCRALGMKLLGTRRSVDEVKSVDGVSIHPASDLPSLLPQSHVVFVCAPLTPETKGLLDATALALLPPRAILVNVARGEIVDEEALYRALADDRLYGAGLDVWYQYPKGHSREARSNAPPSKYPFHQLDNVIMNPHRADHCDDNERHRMTHLAHALRCAAEGKPIPNPIDVIRGY